MVLMHLLGAVALEGQVSRVDTFEAQMGMHSSMLRIQLEKNDNWVVVGPSAWLEKEGITLSAGDSVKLEVIENPMGVLMVSKLKKKEGDKWVEWTLRDQRGRPAWMGSGMGPGMMGAPGGH